MRSISLGAAAAALTALVAAAAATSAPAVTPPRNPVKPVLAKVAHLKVKQREARLHALAAKEGEVDVYSSLSKLVVDPLQKAWAAAYPDVKLNLYRASSEDVTARLLAEAAAHKAGADIVETNGTNMLIFQHRKTLLAPYTQSPFRAQVAKAYRFDSFTADRLEKFVVAWNTSLVQDPPRSFQELAQPRWKGKLALEPTDVDWFAAAYEYFTEDAKPRMSKAAADRMFTAIARNAQIINGHTTEANMLAAGQVQVIVSGHAQSLEQLQAKHAPVAFAPFVRPVIERPQGMGISYTAPHPAAALLFYDWLLSGAGQRVLQENGVEPANPYFGDSAFASKPFTIRVDERPIVAHYRQWAKKYESITGTPAS